MWGLNERKSPKVWMIATAAGFAFSFLDVFM